MNLNNLVFSLKKHLSWTLCYTLMRKFCVLVEETNQRCSSSWESELNWAIHFFMISCTHETVLVWWWQTVSGMTTIIGICPLGIMNILTKSHKDVDSSWWGISQPMNNKLIDQQWRPEGGARSQSCVQPLESQISLLNHFHIPCVHVKPFWADGGDGFFFVISCTDENIWWQPWE